MECYCQLKIKKNIFTIMIKNIIRKIKKKYSILVNKGNKVYCPICESRYKIFGNFGNPKRINAQCYKCNSLERHRLLWMYINNKTDFFNNFSKKLLHFAPEFSFYQIFSNINFIDYYPCDISLEKYKYKGNVKIHKIDITQIPFDDNYFDVIICNHVLEHITDDRLAIQELYRVLKQDGWAYLQVPIEENREITFEDNTIISIKDRKNIFGQSDHIRIYGKDYKNRLESVGLEVTRDNYINSFSDNEIYKYGLMKDEYIYLAKK